ncbi:CK1 family protein kinase [Tritrichomonas foetus]|uniref:non-specific serine/threonine protein kinase n=1 Tax=Tritrichomonas foetus TaxID=1144522 RepID=A0A1J4KT28_9EUKA|nr:CK1 family protein kinase [Tritrichomonas foetus]|eukprot:OHT14447.1 CK1 family protein kinase [Tritrichomonas foetus]
MRQSRPTFQISVGTRVLDLIVGPNIGRGAFGEIYSAIDTKTGILWALKTESLRAKRKTLYFEYQILTQVQSSPYFPRLGFYGRTENFAFFSMEALGPSLTAILRHFNKLQFNMSTSIRTVYHILKCIESFHSLGFVHRDIKPGNILTREGSEHPLCLIDFGLSKVYVNPETGQHLPQRRHVGFRGTRAFASRNAHLSRDLSRRDDLISWFYLAYEFIVAPLPWRHISDRNQILTCKDNFDVESLCAPVAPELYDIWKHISSLEFADAPNYSLIYHKVMEIAKSHEVNFDEPLEWAEFLHQNRQTVASQLGSIEATKYLNIIDDGAYSGNKETFDQPLISPNITTPSPFSHISVSEECCTCCKCY